MVDEAQPHRGRGRRPKESGPPIVEHDNGRRFVRAIVGGKVRLYPIESYCVVNARRLEEVLGRMSQPEIRRAIDSEQANPMRRRKLLLRLTEVLHTRQKQEALEIIRRTVPAQLPRQGRKHTVAQIEAAALRTFEDNPRTGKPRRANGASYRSTLTKLMRQRRAEYEATALADARAKGRDHLTRREREELRRRAGDHFHDHLNAGELCGLCHEVIERIEGLP
jgi:hypothetical protein